MSYSKVRHSDLHALMEFPKGGIFSKVLAKSGGSDHTLMCLSRNTSIDTHTSTREGMVLVLKGYGNFRLFDVDIEMKPGVFIHMPANAPHSLSAEKNLAFLLCLDG